MAKNIDSKSTKVAPFVTLGASNHSKEDREENDFYATPPLATKLLCKLETFNHNIWEPAAGMKHIAKVLEENGYNVYCTDLIQRTDDVIKQDFFKVNTHWDGDIISNPPYGLSQEFVEHSLELVNNGSKVAMFLKLSFLETQRRRKMFLDNPPKIIYVSSNRLGCAKGGDFKGKDNVSSAVCYCWFIWEKGFKGDPIIKWFNDNITNTTNTTQLF